MSYSADQIEVLEGLEPVRKRPAMYIGGTDRNGYHHLLWEIVDNSVDEAINGHATRIEVTIDADLKGARVSDNGRGIPVDKHPKFKKSALELILCTLHAGGKFGGKGYAVSGGLHGVGSSVVNALSEQLEATICRDGSEYRQSYERGVPQGPVKKVGEARKKGTELYFRPDVTIFGKGGAFEPDRIRERLEATSYLHRGLKIILRFEKDGSREEFHHPNGIADFLTKLVAQRKKPPIHPVAFTYEREGDPRIEVALQWTEGTDELIKSYANGIPTPNGGTHENGFKQAVNKAIRGYMDAHNIAPKGLKIASEDIREGVVALVSAYVSEPQFQGQTKDRLNNAEVAAPIENAVRTALEQWLHSNTSVAEAIIARIIISARARQASRAASAQVSRKTAVSHRLNLPGKLSDCASTDPSDCELFLVEGDSAGGNAKAARDRRTQAILPLRGKVLNAERATDAQIMANKELQNIVSALGTGVGKGFDLSKLRYNRIFLLMDADSDGHHIATLLLTFFYRKMPSLIRNGHVFLAQPPLFRIDAGKETYWALDEQQRDKILKGLPRNVKPEISRFKGLGEMPAGDLKETTMDKRQRRALRVNIEDALEAETVISQLMGKDPQSRYEFIMERAKQADASDLDL
jgi:DNA gyrase subunit B